MFVQLTKSFATYLSCLAPFCSIPTDAGANHCGACDNGTVGLIRATASGAIDQILSEEPTVLNYATYYEKPEALEALVRGRLRFRVLNQRERRSLGVVANAMGNGELQLYSSANNGNDSDPKSFRSSVSIAGPIVKMAPPGFVPGLTGTGARVYDEMKRQLEIVADSESAAAASRAYILCWRGLRIGKGGAQAIMGDHTDQSIDDVDEQGRAKHRTVRAVFHNGGDFKLRIVMKVVWTEEGEDEEGNSKLVERMQKITSCEVKIPSPGVYVLDHRLSGRQRVGKMMIGGKLRSVVLYHSTRPVEAQRPINRSIQNIDTKFDTERKEAAFVASLMRGEIDLLPDLGWYAISKNRYSSASALRNHQDRMITMMTPYSTDSGCSCRCCGGRVDYLDLRGEGASEALERIRRIVHGGDEEDDDDDDDDDESDGESDGETGDDDAIRLLDGTPAPINKNGVPIALGVRVSTYWSGAPVSGIITLATKDVCEVAHHPQNGLCRFVYEHGIDELYLPEDAEAKNIVFNPSQPMSALPLLFSCADCVAPLELGDDDLLSSPCRSCMSTSRLGRLAFCAPCGRYTCLGFIDPVSREREFVCTGKEGRSDGVALDFSNVRPSTKHSCCKNCDNERIKRSETEKRRNDGSKANDSSRGTVEYHRKLLTAMEDETTRTAGGNIRWITVAEIIGDDDRKKVKKAYQNTWQGKRAKKCGECERCDEGEQCVVDLETFEKFLKTEKGRNEKFGYDAQANNVGKQ